MSRKRKVPSRYDSNGNEYFHSYPKLFYCQHYFDVVGNIKQRFDQPDYSIYNKLQNIILKASCFQDFWSELNSLEDLYNDEFNFFPLTHYRPVLLFYPLKMSENLRFSDVFRGYRKATPCCNGLKPQLEILPKSITSKLGFSEIISSMKNLSAEKRFLFSEVIKLIEIILIASATNDASERSWREFKHPYVPQWQIVD